MGAGRWLEMKRQQTTLALFHCLDNRFEEAFYFLTFVMDARLTTVSGVCLCVGFCHCLPFCYSLRVLCGAFVDVVWIQCGRFAHLSSKQQNTTKLHTTLTPCPFPSQGSLKFSLKVISRNPRKSSTSGSNDGDKMSESGEASWPVTWTRQNRAVKGNQQPQTPEGCPPIISSCLGENVFLVRWQFPPLPAAVSGNLQVSVAGGRLMRMRPAVASSSVGQSQTRPLVFIRSYERPSQASPWQGKLKRGNSTTFAGGSQRVVRSPGLHSTQRRQMKRSGDFRPDLVLHKP
ncbi:hypothetical protein RRG08_014049 [Elysia crispata]|uniref:Uncharacterized protein n=1 Tax=Elysia crispata TaxID=231223 RepID=A0AAE1A1C2_9GAST|nr:hypothetical protein RRG08_014049 [Elysia crispata]